MIKNISVLGSTGSIGTQTLEIAKEQGFKVSALSAHKNIKLLEEQVRRFKPLVVCVYDESAANIFKKNVNDLNIKVVTGTSGLCEAACVKDADTVLNSVVGMIGLEPTIEAIKCKKDIALANKETLVVGGALVMPLAKENNVKILPVDSEHSAIFQCLQGCNDKNEIKKLILTASGGPFFGKTKEALKEVTKEQALNHPNWSMGSKITIDSATMMNKGLEIIEACWLFDIPVENIEVLIHRESIVHSLVEFIDNSVIAQLGVASMKIPIQYALTYPRRIKSNVPRLDLAKMANLSFYKPDFETFECLGVCIDAIKKGGTYPCVANGANEEAVKFFLDGQISFLEIGKLVKESVIAHKGEKIKNLNDVLKADKFARDFVINKVKGIK